MLSEPDVTYILTDEETQCGLWTSGVGIMMLLSRRIKKNAFLKSHTNKNEPTGKVGGYTGHIRQWQTHTLSVTSPNPQRDGSQAPDYMPDSWT